MWAHNVGTQRITHRDGWKGDFQKFTSLRQAVVLSGPFYLTPSHPEWDVWQDWYHTDPANFTVDAEWQQQYVLGGMGTIWSDIVKEGQDHSLPCPLVPQPASSP